MFLYMALLREIQRGVECLRLKPHKEALSLDNKLVLETTTGDYHKSKLKRNERTAVRTRKHKEESARINKERKYPFHAKLWVDKKATLPRKKLHIKRDM
jgi:hypothetical protein